MNGFRDVAHCSEQELRELLEADEPRQRVWAAWALGLRLGPGFSETARAVLTTEPNSGARRHFVVMMAGFGEVRPIVTLALHDPEPLVRSTACQYVLRFASRDETLYEALAPTLRDQSAYVRRSLVLYMDVEAPDWFANAVDSFIEDDDYEVKHAVVERRLEREPERIATVLKNVAFDESVSIVLRRRIIEAWATREMASLLEYLESHDTHLSLSTVDVISDALDVLPWSVLEELAGSSDPMVATILLRALPKPPHCVEVREWLLSVLLGEMVSWFEREDVMRGLIRSYPADDLGETEQAIASEVRSMSRHSRYVVSGSGKTAELAPWQEVVDEFRLLDHFLDVLDHFVIPN